MANSVNIHTQTFGAASWSDYNLHVSILEPGEFPWQSQGASAHTKPPLPSCKGESKHESRMNDVKLYNQFESVECRWLAT